MIDTSFVRVPETIALAIEVINGVYGNGDARKQALRKAGYDTYDYNRVQKCVNELFPIWKKYGDD